MTEESRLERLVESGKAIVPPLTLLTALLFYFGYVSARSQYEYFGVDVDTIGLGTQDYIMRSPQPLLTPLLGFAAAGVGSVAVYAAVRRRIHPETSARTATRLRLLGRGGQVAGLTGLAGGLLLLLGYAFLRDWQLYGLLTPLLIAAGGTLFRAGSAVRRLLRPPDSPTPLRRTSTALVYLVIAVTAFWMTATVAQWSGRGLAMYEASRLDRLPSVILDTKESLFLRSPGIQETQLPQLSDGQTFRYRYRHLRLLIHGKDRMFLVADRWTPSSSTVIVPLDGSVRVQFQFQNQRP